jgi:hypothetical protein
MQFLLYKLIFMNIKIVILSQFATLDGFGLSIRSN